MATSQKLITRYANVFLAYATQSGELKAIGNGVTLLQNQFKAAPILDNILHNPTIPRVEKHKLLEKICKDALHPILWNFIEIIIDQYQIGLLKEILISFQSAYQEYIGIATAVVTTAVAIPAVLTKSFIEEVKQLVFCKEVLLVQQVDPSIIGGYILQIGALKLDKSVKHSLRLLKLSL
ncbi:ATP synthase F1 subunit delta [Candidatus Cardinium hertigii]|uniref:ATP synthase subunit delta n=1 Tax=Candidatus Cardinium hertigii TaxID=247481 RepID=A0A3N2QBM7_9BACT|nr:ATP synthase F1 subunit delta [Candidatus Cardinium hertigii]ROT47214.1 ATP synthase F1 subunit delta [Candidatus Cardinium hertigii]